jgi:Pyruvate/2-oxoacid:ferredoxin oxidoreductase delta subunit/coenzyme F420-reducing hydrogenase delta subunit
VSRKRSAVIFAKDVRTSDSGDELLYRQARQAGVAVIRYKTLEITSKDGIYNVRSSDGFTDISVKTRWVIKASANIPPEIDAFAGRLRLKKSAGSDTAGRYWLYPVFTSRKGVYYIDASLLPEAGLEGVAQELIRSVAFADGDNAAHAHIDPLKCAFCYTCFRACPHAALAPDTAASSILVLETMCDACGICVALCPANAIELQESTASRSGAERGALKIIACENSTYYAAITALGGSPQDYGVCVESVPCCGSVTGRQITSALQDFDAVLVAACMEDACRHFDGNIRGCVHTKRLIEDMARLGLNDNVAFYNASASMAGPLKLEIDRLLGISAGNIDIREG